MTYVVGTNGGMMPCGADLTIGEVTAPYYCGRCFAAGLRGPHDQPPKETKETKHGREAVS